MGDIVSEHRAVGRAEHDASKSLNIKCPFCGDNDFDLIGLKLHLEKGYCEKYEEVRP